MAKKTFQCIVLRTPEYMRVLEDEKKLTFSVEAGKGVSHHQIDVTDFDTREKIEARMAEIGAQVAEEMVANKKKRPETPVSTDIMALVEEAP